MTVSKILMLVVVALIAIEVVSAEKHKEKPRWGFRLAENDTCHCLDDKPHHPPKPEKKREGHHERPRHKGRHHLPTPQWCRCLPKPTEKSLTIVLSILKTFVEDHKDTKSLAFKSLASKIKEPIMKVLKPKRFGEIKFTKGSGVLVNVVIHYEMKHPITAEDAEKKVTNAVKKGEFKDLKVDEKSVGVIDGYEGVKLGQWETKPEEHDAKCEPRFNRHHERKEEDEEECWVVQHRHCHEVNNSCDAINRLRKVSCEMGCSKMWFNYGCWKYTHGRRHKIFFLVGGIIAAVLLVTVIVVVIRKKSVSVKYIKHTSSANDVKGLTDNDFCAEPLPSKTPVA